MVAIVVAMGQNRVIGNKGDLAWGRIKSDLQHFKELTTGHPVIMGRKTWESLPEKWRPLPGRTNIIVSRNPKFHGVFGTYTKPDLAEAVSFAETLDRNVFVIGGGAIYAAALEENLVDTVYLTVLDCKPMGDTFFPALSAEWQITEQERFEQDETNECGGIFYTYSRAL